MMNPQPCEGTATFYNPALVGSYCITVGRPLYGIEYEGTYNVFSAEHVFPHTKAGYQAVCRLLAARADAHAIRYQELAADSVLRSQYWQEQAANPNRYKKPRRRPGRRR